MPARHTNPDGPLGPKFSLTKSAGRCAGRDQEVWDEAVADHTSAGTYGQELHVVKAVLANTRIHDMSGLADVIKDNDGETTLLTLTPVADDVNNLITVIPS